MTDVPTPQSSEGLSPNPGDIVILASDGLNAQAYERLIGLLGEAGFRGAVTGLGTEPTGQPTLETTHLHDEVTEWKTRYETDFDDTYLEEVFDPRLGTTRPLVTHKTIKGVFREQHGPDRSTAISAGKTHRRLVEAVEKLHPHRTYLQEGALYMGRRKLGSGYRWEQPYWGLTPEALFGLTQEDEVASGLSGLMVVRVEQVLSQVAGTPTSLVQKSGWLGHERSQHVG